MMNDFTNKNDRPQNIASYVCWLWRSYTCSRWNI